MEKIKNYNQHIHSNLLMPLNFKLMKEIKIQNYQLPYKIQNENYQCDYFFRINYYKPLNIF
jgi:hypothetical protein